MESISWSSCMVITFRCKRSGNTVSFSNETDIAELRKHEGYEEVKKQEPPAEEKTITLKRPGRPKKQ